MVLTKEKTILKKRIVSSFVCCTSLDLTRKMFMMNYDSAFETPLSSNLIGFSSPEERQWGNKWNCIAQVRRSPSEFAVCSILVYITGNRPRACLSF
ncbi:hypothetical protein LEMLEM_LOCUS14949, partial [Lemmus lemmus]